MTEAHDQKIEALLKRYKKEQADFENHSLWRELNTTPQNYFAWNRAQIKHSDVAAEVWQKKLNEAKRVVETRVQESKANYKKIDLTQFKGLKA